MSAGTGKIKVISAARAGVPRATLSEAEKVLPALGVEKGWSSERDTHERGRERERESKHIGLMEGITTCRERWPTTMLLRFSASSKGYVTALFSLAFVS
jgi:hypothetical protein